MNIPLDTSDPANMALAFSQVAKTKPMAVEQAIQLGFHPDMLEAVSYTHLDVYKRQCWTRSPKNRP